MAEPKTKPTRAGLGRKELFEGARTNFFGHAGAIVGNGQRDTRVLTVEQSRCDGHAPTIDQRISCIDDQVQERVLELFWVEERTPHTLVE